MKKNVCVRKGISIFDLKKISFLLMAFWWLKKHFFEGLKFHTNGVYAFDDCLIKIILSQLLYLTPYRFISQLAENVLYKDNIFLLIYNNI